MMSENEIIRADESDAGCWVDGHWGQYALAHFIYIAAHRGYRDTKTPDVVDIARRHLACIWPSDAEPISDDEWEILHDAADEVEEWMTRNVAPAGYYFTWRDGECFLVAPWKHDPARDGSGCTWCGAYAQVDENNLCEDCYHEV